MYKIDVDKTNKLINVELCGQMDADELEACTNESLDIVSQFNKKEVSILAALDKLDPVVQECLPICMRWLSDISTYTNRIVFVQQSVVTRMQFETIITKINKQIKYPIISVTCLNMQDALEYIK